MLSQDVCSLAYDKYIKRFHDWFWKKMKRGRRFFQTNFSPNPAQVPVKFGLFPKHHYLGNYTAKSSKYISFRLSIYANFMANIFFRFFEIQPFLQKKDTQKQPFDRTISRLVTLSAINQFTRVNNAQPRMSIKSIQFNSIALFLVSLSTILRR